MIMTTLRVNGHILKDKELAAPEQERAAEPAVLGDAPMEAMTKENMQ